MKRIKSTLIKLIRRIPFYPTLRTLKQRWELKEWERRGRSAPPPHIVKQQTLRDFAERFKVKILIETGTYYGDMVEAMKNYFSLIYSIELSNELYKKAKRRFAGDARIKIIHGDSAIELGKLIESIDQPALFWLDGHYSGGVTARGDKDTPIYEELAHIFNSPIIGHVIVIDDARYFGIDPFYPSIDDLTRYIRANSPNVRILVEDDSIRIFPNSQTG